MKEVGYTENPKGSNRTKYGEAYGWNGVPWCVIFIWWLLRDLVLKTASSTTLYNWFKKNNRIYKTPEIGDVVFFNFNSKPKTGECTHVGIVTQIISKTKIKTIEGNTSFERESDGSPAKESNGGAVAERTRTIGSTIVGFGRPNYEGAKTTILKKGSKGNDVIELHKKLRTKGYGVDATNNVFDDLTERCVKHFQALKHLEVDGIVGPKTAQALNN